MNSYHLGTLLGNPARIAKSNLAMILIKPTTALVLAAVLALINKVIKRAIDCKLGSNYRLTVIAQCY